MTRLELEGVSARYGDVGVLEDVSLRVEDGELLVLVGPSGCGKSTLLRVVAGLVPQSAGSVRLDGERIDERTPAERDVAMVFQNYALYPHMSVRRNLSFPLELRRTPRAEIARRVGEAADLLRLGELLERKPADLSGGQMQRVALGRALVRRPRLFLFDEPLSNLDAGLRTRMRSEIARLHAELGITTLYVTHDQAEAMTLGSRIAVLEGGRLLQVGPPLEVFERPATAFVGGFIGSPPMNLVRGSAAGGVFRCPGFSVPTPAAEEGPMQLGLRPHEIALGAPHDDPPPRGSVALSGSVAFVEALGTQTLVECDVEGTRLVVSVDGPASWRVGDAARLEFRAAATHAFRGADGARL